MPPSWRGAFLFLGGKKRLGDGVFPLMSPTTPPPRKALLPLLVPMVFQRMASPPGTSWGFGGGVGLFCKRFSRSRYYRCRWCPSSAT
jgi:hypothetical protein